ncbi:hypothetical protein [Porphyrobacter sp. GA68]|uniref:hypothetical protein n=1 Tax=Porphyrobacter sp. GA68 TaxID=2883480 RepID=UPI001D17DAF9|nr:hypothetical protein [Porphyrobacter sp. GA68]
MVRYALQLTLLAIAVLYAWRRGGPPEKAVAFILVAMALSGALYNAMFGVQDHQSIDWGNLMIDSSAFVALAAVALREERLWTILAASAQLISLLSHLLRALHMDMGPLIYAVMSRAPSYLLIALLLLGTALQHRRLRQSATS